MLYTEHVKDFRPPLYLTLSLEAICTCQMIVSNIVTILNDPIEANKLMLDQGQLVSIITLLHNISNYTKTCLRINAMNRNGKA